MKPIYYFHGIERKSFVFDTPNELGAILLLIYFCILGFTLDRRWRVTGLASLSLFFVTIFLASTYSRAAAIALAFGLLIVFLSVNRDFLLRLGLVAGITLAGYSIMPKNVERMTQISTEDASLANRIAVWRASVGLIAKQPAGIGSKEFQHVFNLWYKPEHLNDTYRTAVNSYLTIACFWGLVALAALVFLQSFLISVSLLRCKQLDDIFLLCLAVGHVAFCITAVSSTFCLSLKVIFAYLVYLIISILKMLKDRVPWLSLKRPLTISIGFSSGLVTVLYLAGVTIFATPTMWAKRTIDGQVLVEQLDAFAPKGDIFCMIPKERLNQALTKNLLRPLIREGWSVHILESKNGLPITPIHASNAYGSWLRGRESPVILGCGSVSSCALAAAKNHRSKALAFLAGDLFIKETPSNVNHTLRSLEIPILWASGEMKHPNYQGMTKCAHESISYVFLPESNLDASVLMGWLKQKVLQ